MFENLESGQKLSKDEYAALVPELRTRLLKAQARLEGAGFPVIMLINGPEAAGKSEMTNVLHEWLDARYLVSEAYAEPTEEERAHPEFWRYWCWLPPAGRIALFQGNWYARPILDRATRQIGAAGFARELDRIRKFERTLADDGALFIKVWLHVSKRDQKKRLERLEKNPDTRFRVTKQDWRNHAMHGRIQRVCEEVLRETSTHAAPWTVIDAADDRQRNVRVAIELAERLEERLKETDRRPPPRPEPPRSDPQTPLDRVDLTKQVSKSEYEERAPALQAKLNRLARKFLRKQRSAILVFEGVDAAGKGGAIRRIVWALDARQYRIMPVAAPNEEERAHHYLWRFYRQLPRRGKLTIYDRSWYGRVLVERVEGLASEPEWSRAYDEINDFEHELTSDGIVLVKFWLQISADEQLRRFQARESEPWKQHKITAEDYRNRSKKNAYEAAAADMLERCSTPYAPFAVIPAEDKHYARLSVLETVCERLEQAL